MGFVSFDLFDLPIIKIDLGIILDINILLFKRIFELIPIFILIYKGLKYHPNTTNEIYDLPYKAYYLGMILLMIGFMGFIIIGKDFPGINANVFSYINSLSLISLVIAYFFGNEYFHEENYSVENGWVSSNKEEQRTIRVCNSEIKKEDRREKKKKWKSK